MNFLININFTMSWLRQLVADLSTWSPGFDLRPVDVRFVVDKVELGYRLFPNSKNFVFPLSVPNRQMLYTRLSFTCHQQYITSAGDSTVK